MSHLCEVAESSHSILGESPIKDKAQSGQSPGASSKYIHKHSAPDIHDIEHTPTSGN